MPDLLYQLPAIVLAGLCTYVWLIARDRRKAVDRLTKYLYETPRKPAEALGCALVINDIEDAGFLRVSHGKCIYDTPGRVIRRSVRKAKR